MVYISILVHVKFAEEHSTTFGSLYAPGPFIRKINFTVSPTTVNSHSCSKRADSASAHYSGISLGIIDILLKKRIIRE